MGIWRVVDPRTEELPCTENENRRLSLSKIGIYTVTVVCHQLLRMTHHLGSVTGEISRIFSFDIGFYFLRISESREYNMQYNNCQLNINIGYF